MTHMLTGEAPVVWFLLYAALGFLVVARITRFLNDDYLFQPARDWIERTTHRGKLYYLITCPWCASIYIAAPIAAVVAAYAPAHTPRWLIGIGLWMAYSYVYGLIAQNWDGDE